MLQYIIQAIAYQLLFLVVYDVFLKKETFFNWNRFYLLLTAVLSLILPFIKIEGFKNVVPQQFVFSFPNINLKPDMVVLDEITIGVKASKPFWTFENIFLIGAAVAGVFFIVKLFHVINLIRNNPKQKTHNVLLVALLNSAAAFSFFNYIFLGERIQGEEKKSIISHELVHVREKHTLDLLLFEVLRIVFWFNPLIYMYQNRIADLHEFIADSKAAKTNKKAYYQNLLSQVFETKQMSFINPFFKQSLIKKRIIMLQKSKSKQIQLLKYALLIPMVIGMLMYSSCSDEATDGTKNNIDLSKYGYTIELSDNGLVEVPAVKHEEYETFLKNNSDYVSWAQINNETNEITYSVHSKEEQVPDNLTQLTVNSPDGGSYDMYISLPNSDETNSKEASSLTKKVDAIKAQIQVQGNISNEEEKGLALLVNMVTVKAVEVNQEFIQDVQAYIEAENKTELHQKIADLFDIIQKQGNISDEEEKSLKTLLVLVSKEGLDSSFYEDVNGLNEIPYSIVDKTPLFPGCDINDSSEEKRLCFNSKLSSFVAKNFNTNLGKDIGLSGEQKIYVLFKIDTNGDIVDIKSRAPHPELDAEAIRIIKMLPKMVPGEHQGKKVVVPYYLPIKFQINE